MDDTRIEALTRIIREGITAEIAAIVGEPLDLRWPPEVTLAGLCNCLAFLIRITGEKLANYAPMVASGHVAATDENVRLFQERWGNMRPLPAWDDPRVLHIERLCEEALAVPHELYRRPPYLQMAAYSIIAGQLARYRQDTSSSVVERVSCTVPFYPESLADTYQQKLRPTQASGTKAKKRSRG